MNKQLLVPIQVAPKRWVTRNRGHQVCAVIGDSWMVSGSNARRIYDIDVWEPSYPTYPRGAA